MHTQRLFTGAVASGDEADAASSVERGASVGDPGRPDAADKRDCPSTTPGTATRSESGGEADLRGILPATPAEAGGWAG